MAGLTDVIAYISKSAPLLASSLTSPVSGLVLGLLANVFGADKNNLSDILGKMENDSDAKAKLLQIQNAHEATLAKITNDNFAIETADKQDARKYSAVYKTFLIQMAFVITAGFFGVLMLLFVPLEISDEGRNLLSMLVGMLASKWQTVIDFFYGSSHSRRSRFNR